MPTWEKKRVMSLSTQIIHTEGYYKCLKCRRSFRKVCNLADLSDSILKAFSLPCGFSRILSNSAHLISLSFSLFRLPGNASEDTVLTTTV